MLFNNLFTVMLPHHHIDFLHFKQILESVNLTRNIRAPWRWSEWRSKHVRAFLSFFNMNILDYYFIVYKSALVGV